MSSKRMSTWQKATAIVPLALLSGAWTASLTATSASASPDEAGRLPDGTALPAQTVDVPATVSAPGEIAPGVPAGAAQTVVAEASTDGIPAAALAAYQRAAQVIDSADSKCHLEWPLIAAIGRVESNHGRFAGNVLTAEGLSSPGIYGIALDGTNGTAKITDTDAGQLDNDQVFDRAVGPMQFIPSTWSVVGVDGDGDGTRNPQDIDDASLATAVYLCSGNEDLGTRAGQESAVYRYNHSNEYVALVLSIMDAYTLGEYDAVPTSAAGATVFTPDFGDSVFATGTRGHRPPKHDQTGSAEGGTTTGSGGTGTGATTGGSGGGTGTGGGSGGGDGKPKGVVTVVTDLPQTVAETLTEVEKATQYCLNELTGQELDLLGGLAACTDAYLQGGVNAVQNLLDDLLGGLLGGLLGN